MRAAAIAAALIVAACAPQEEPAVTTPSSSASGNATGPELVLLPVPSEPTISLSVSFRVGSEDDPAGKEGLAYLTGQLIADGATRQNRLEAILEKLYPIASDYDIRVDREMSTLTGRTHRDNIAIFVELFRNAIESPAFLQSDFDRIKSETINYLTNTLRYASDEELGKAALYDFVFAGTRYAHPVEGTVEGLRAITLDDVRAFYSAHYRLDDATVGLAGGYDGSLPATMASLELATADTASAPPSVEPAPIHGRRVVIVDKPGADTSISFGFPLDVHRGERDFYALWIANSWLGEHRNQASHLFQVIRDARGLNYGDYSYIEAFPEGGRRTMPPVNVGRRHQIFEVWIRTLPNDQAIFALRAALRELTRLVDNGMREEDFELTRSFLKNYVLQFADTTEGRLGYAIDDRFYGIGAPGHLEIFRRMMDELTLEEVNAAIKRHLQTDNVKIAIVTGDAAGLRAVLESDAPTPISYATPKPDVLLAEDKEIAAFPLDIVEDGVRVVPVDAMFAGDKSPSANR
jgi:zinc protease